MRSAGLRSAHRASRAGRAASSALLRVRYGGQPGAAAERGNVAECGTAPWPLTSCAWRCPSVFGAGRGTRRIWPRRDADQRNPCRARRRSVPTPTASRHACNRRCTRRPTWMCCGATTRSRPVAGAQRLAAAPPDPNRAHRLAAFLARSELNSCAPGWLTGISRSPISRSSRRSRPRCDDAALEDRAGPRTRWPGSPRRAGMSALYADATHTPTSTLTVAGTYRLSGPPLPDRGTHFIAGAFPPAEWCPAPESAAGTDMLMLMPVGSATSRDWGVPSPSRPGRGPRWIHPPASERHGHVGEPPGRSARAGRPRSTASRSSPMKIARGPRKRSGEARPRWPRHGD